VAYLLEVYITSRKVAVSIPDEIVGLFRWFIPSGRTMGPRVDLSA